MDQSVERMKSRVYYCLHRLSDGEAMRRSAEKELSLIAQNLGNEDFAPFLECISIFTYSLKPYVCRVCVSLLEVVSKKHGDGLSPHFMLMLSTLISLQDDRDSDVELACIFAVGSMAANVRPPPSASLLKPLVEAFSCESVTAKGNESAKICAVSCLIGALKSGPVPEDLDKAALQEIIPKVLSMAKSSLVDLYWVDKMTLLELVSMIVDSGFVGDKDLLGSIISMAVEFMGRGNNMHVRGESARILTKVPVAVERDLALEFEGVCVNALYQIYVSYR